MEIAQKLIEQLESDQLQEKLEEMLAHLEVLTEENKSEVKDYFNDKRRLLVESVKDIVIDGDEDEFSELMVTLWLENRLEWNRYNCQMQYQTFSKGEANPILMARGACLAELIDIIEKRLNAQDLYWVVKIAVNPISAVSYRIEQTQKLIEKTSNYGKISQEIINNQLEMLEHLSRAQANKKIVQKFKSNINRTMNTIEKSGFLEISDFADCVESTVVKGMKASNLQFQVSYQKPKMPIGVPPEIVQAIDFVLKEYIENLVDQSMEKTSEERSEKSPFINFKWSVEFNKDCFYFNFEDDGLGKVSWDLENTVYNELDIDASLENNEGKGSKLSLAFSFFAVHEFVIFELMKSNAKQKYAIAASKVVKLIKEQDIVSKDNFSDVFAAKDGSTVQRLKWPSKYSNDEKYKNFIIFKNDEEKSFALDCQKFVGFSQSKLKRCGQKNLCGKQLYGFIEKDSELVKVLDTNEIAQDFYENDGMFKILL